ncbi:MAG: hypothetical protein TYPL_3100 [Candidatus Tyloplasma litorale]|nr:MAG: hypothetical protein TYPL_3100 [Mycoplasmatales bacterium]
MVFEWVLLLFTIIFGTLIMFFCVRFFFNLKNIESSYNNMADLYSSVELNIKTRKIKFIPQNNGEFKSREYNIEEFIYMISTNSETRNFKDFLKKINNKVDLKVLNELISNLNESILLSISYIDETTTIGVIYINNNSKIVNGKWKFQIAETKLLENTSLDISYFNRGIKEYDDDEIFNLVSKDIKNLKTKGFTLMKIASKYKLVSSTKDFLILKLQLLRLSQILENKEFKTYLSEDGSIYVLNQSIRRNNHFLINRVWNNVIRSYFSKKSSNEYIDFKIEDFNIFAIAETRKDKGKINEAFIKLNLIYKESLNLNKLSYKKIKDIFYKANNLNQESIKIIKLLKDKQPIIRSASYKLKERQPNLIHEFFIDYSIEIIKDIVDYSFRYKKQIIELVLGYSNQKAKTVKFKNDLVAVMLEVSNISLVSKIIPKLGKISENFYIAFAENTNDRNDFFSWRNSAASITKNNCGIIQLIRDEKEGSIKLTRSIKPSYILLSKTFINEKVHSKEISIKLKVFKNTLDKKTKIISIK